MSLMSRFDFRSWTRTLNIVCLFVYIPLPSRQKIISSNLDAGTELRREALKTICGLNVRHDFLTAGC
jgi:hypothetical protein